MIGDDALSRVSVAEMDAILGKRYSVLDDGFLRVVDYMGSDDAIVQAARVSFGKGTKRVHEDKGLIRYLMRNHHTTPFEMCEIKLHIRAPMDCWRQWIRHRTASVNEYSTRYSEAIDSAQRTGPDEWRLQATANRQGSADVLGNERGETLTRRESDFLASARDVYQERLQAGVAREQARKDLPLSTYTEAYWKIDLHNLLHFLRLRMDSHAQKEIRSYASLIGNEIVSRWCPHAWEAFVDYQMKSVSLTSLDADIIASVVLGKQDEAIDIAESGGILQRDGTSLKPNREGNELEAKMIRLGLNAPW